MGSVSATTKIGRVRVNLNEVLPDSDAEVAGAGSRWLNSELLSYLNKSKDRLVILLREVREDYFFTSGATISLNTTTKEYSLASGVRQLTGLKITTSGYEHIRLKRMDMSNPAWQSRDALPAGNSAGISTLYYDIVGSGKIKFCDFPPAALTLSYDYDGVLADYTLSASSTVDLNDELSEFEEAYATRLAYNKYPEEADRRKVWDAEILRLEPIVKSAVSSRNIREPRYVQTWRPG